MANTSTVKLIKDLSKKIGSLESNMNVRFGKIETSLDFVKMDVKNLEKQNEKLDKKVDKKFDKAMTVLVDIAGQFKKFDEERVILSAHSRNHTDRIEKLEKKTFGTIQI